MGSILIHFYFLKMYFKNLMFNRKCIDSFRWMFQPVVLFFRGGGILRSYIEMTSISIDVVIRPGYLKVSISPRRPQEINLDMTCEATKVIQLG